MSLVVLNQLSLLAGPLSDPHFTNAGVTWPTLLCAASPDTFCRHGSTDSWAA
jgi:hypothetical protein